MPYEKQRADWVLSCDPRRIQIDEVLRFLQASYWGKGLERAQLERAIEHSMVFGVYAGVAQIAFARVVTDYINVAYLADVFVLDAYQGKGIGKWLVEEILAHPDLQALRRWILVTRDAHSLYEKFGFHPLAVPQKFMERENPHAVSWTTQPE